MSWHSRLHECYIGLNHVNTGQFVRICLKVESFISRKKLKFWAQILLRMNWTYFFFFKNVHEQHLVTNFAGPQTHQKLYIPMRCWEYLLTSRGDFVAVSWVLFRLWSNFFSTPKFLLPASYTRSCGSKAPSILVFTLRCIFAETETCLVNTRDR